MDKVTNNRGISLLEVLVVIAIITIMSGSVIMTLHMVHRSKPINCVKSMDSCLEQAKSEAMSKGTQRYFVLYKSSESKNPGYYVGSTTSPDTYVKHPENDTKVSDKNVKIEVTLNDESVLEIENNTLFITFDRASGAVRECYVEENGAAPAKKDAPKSIKVSGGGRESTLRIVAETGKHFVE